LKLKKMTDEEVLNTLLEMLNDRVQMNTAFVRDQETGNITHQVVQIMCGEFVSVSKPEPLDVIMRVATAEEQGITVN
jgi:hypothetical protein